MLEQILNFEHGLNLIISLLTLLSLSTALLFNLLIPKLTQNFITKEELKQRLQTIKNKFDDLENDLQSTKQAYQNSQEILISLKKDIEWIKEAIKSKWTTHKTKT